MIGKLSGKHLDCFIHANQKYNILHGSVSSGKTITSLLMLVDFIINGPPGEILLVGKTERTLRRNVINPLITIFGKSIEPSGGECKIFGRRCYLVGANDERSEQKIRGISLVGAYCDEMTLYPESFFQMLKTRLRSPGARMIGTTNPDSPNHYLLTDLIENEKIENKSIWHFTLDDNPFLDPSYVQDMKNSFTGLWYKRYILGDWVLAEGIIFSMFDPEKHVIDKLPEDFDYYLCSADYGTSTVCVFLLFGIKGDKIYVLKELYWNAQKEKYQKTDIEYAQDMKKFLGEIKPKNICIDPSAPSFIVQLRRSGFTNVKEAVNDVLPGLMTTSSLISNNRLFVHKGCVNLLKEFSSYCWDAKAQDDGLDKPLKQFDHCADALRYCCHTNFAKNKPTAIKNFL